MNGFDIYGFTFLVAGLILVLMLAWQRFKTRQIKMMSMAEIARDEAYRKLAEESISVQQKMMESQQKMNEELSKLRERITGIEKMLREVE
jgi:NurA-like 5'-3' nuclease